MNKLFGHEYIFNNFIELYEKNILPNKILLSGKKGIGKSLFANHFVNHIYSNDNEIKANILIENNSHPNIFRIFKKKDKKNIEISQIRQMIEFQNRSSFNNKIKSIIIDDLEYLNDNSTNALLKSIEEPNQKVLFILINNSGRNIPDTLRSRCIEFKLFLKYKEIKLIVDNHFNDEIYHNISNDFVNYYTSPSFLIFLIEFFIENSIDYINLTIEEFIIDLIKNKYYLKNQFINENLNIFIELFFYKNINRSKKISYKIKEYFYLKLSQIKKYNLDLETFFLEFEEKLLSE